MVPTVAALTASCLQPCMVSAPHLPFLDTLDAGKQPWCNGKNTGLEVMGLGENIHQRPLN